MDLKRIEVMLLISDRLKSIEIKALGAFQCAHFQKGKNIVRK